MTRLSIDNLGHVPSFKTGKEVNALAIIRHMYRLYRRGQRPTLKGLRNTIRTKRAHKVWMNRATEQLRSQLESSSGSQTTAGGISTGPYRQSSTALSTPAPSRTTVAKSSRKKRSRFGSSNKAKKARTSKS